MPAILAKSRQIWYRLRHDEEIFMQLMSDNDKFEIIEDDIMNEKGLPA